MSTKAREVIWGGRIMGANIRAQGARETAKKAAKEADRAEAEAWSIHMEGGGPAQPSPTIGQCLNGGFGLARGGMQSLQDAGKLATGRDPPARDTPIWKLGACQLDLSNRRGRATFPARPPFQGATSDLTQQSTTMLGQRAEAMI